MLLEPLMLFFEEDASDLAERASSAAAFFPAAISVCVIALSDFC